MTGFFKPRVFGATTLTLFFFSAWFFRRVSQPLLAAALRLRLIFFDMILPFGYLTLVPNLFLR
jgi:hypothetical protein